MSQNQRYTAFTSSPSGGNPTGVVLEAHDLDETQMQQIATDLGYSETAFVMGGGQPAPRFGLRFFSPLAEVAFCGHATIAASVALAESGLEGPFRFATGVGEIVVSTERRADGLRASLRSVPGHSRPVTADVLRAALDALGWSADDLDPDYPPHVAYAGNDHLVLVAKSRQRLAELHYDFSALKQICEQEGWTTLQLIWPQAAGVFHSRNPFPIGGVVEDPATGAAAAAFGAYLREIGRVLAPASFTIIQGEDMGRPSQISVTVDPAETGITVSGTAVQIPNGPAQSPRSPDTRDGDVVPDGSHVEKAHVTTPPSREQSARNDQASIKVDVGNLTFDVVTAGPEDGRPVLLLHGFPQTSWSWRHVIPALSRAGHRVLALDQRGYSPQASPDSVEEYAGEHLVADAIGVLDALDISAADIVGHDWGAAVAWQLASHFAERVNTLTAISVPHPRAFVEALTSDRDQQDRSQYLRDFASAGYEATLLADDAARLRNLFGTQTGVDVEHIVSRLGSAQLRRALNWYAAQSLERAATTPHTPVPTLHIWSDDDWALGEYAARATERFVSGPYQLEVLSGISHWIPEHAPDQTARLVLRQLARFPVTETRAGR
jgi:PhzF family phenazine biosynthesis protein